MIESVNGLLPVRWQAIIWTNAGLSLIRPSGTNFSEIWIKIHQCFHSRKWIWKCHQSWWRHPMEHFPHYWPFVRGIHRSLVNSPHKGQWCGTLMFSLICVWINACVNNCEAGDLRRHRAHYHVTVMNCPFCLCLSLQEQVSSVINVPQLCGHFISCVFMAVEEDHWTALLGSRPAKWWSNCVKVKMIAFGHPWKILIKLCHGCVFLNARYSQILHY